MSNLIENRASEIIEQYDLANVQLTDIDKQIKALQARKKSINDSLEQFKTEARELMEDNNMKAIESEQLGIQIKLGKGTPIVSVEDDSKVPEKYWRVKRELDKTYIKKALQAGEEIEGCSLSTGKARLTINTEFGK